ncbi:TIGR01244 family sulfur transferase [Actibacterium lipolyticum]|uniref:Beta-lactamase hydrolase-like protein n=1 Tax=Actibacterium lipolyticum TaxID=1524263 RepID=A0A238JUL6_9RHOB|nr:TIGR01244 family sulfur transferase [Actibacterium lipolyticum]SMX34349.1 Beta-lactamase hydrolase-like protein [Actibacterium lipolyticum]
MEIRQITPDFAAAPQIAAADIAEAAAAGFKTILCNRPDDEVPGQPCFADIEAAAKEAGLEIRFLPLAPGGLSMELINEFRDALDSSDGPVLAYCRSGTRSTTLWGLAQACKMAPDDILKAAAQGGYDLSNVRQMLEQLHASA